METDSIKVHPLTQNPTAAWKEISKKQKIIVLNFKIPTEPVQSNKVRFVCMSDTHSQVHNIQFPIPDGDVFIHAGDFTRYGDKDEVIEFNKWLMSLPHKYKIVICGNHELDFAYKLSKYVKNPTPLFGHLNGSEPRNSVHQNGPGYVFPSANGYAQTYNNIHSQAYAPIYSFGSTQIQPNTPIYNSGHSQIQIHQPIHNSGHAQGKDHLAIYYSGPALAQAYPSAHNTTPTAKAHQPVYNSGYTQGKPHLPIYTRNTAHIAKVHLPINNSGYTQAQGPTYNSKHTRTQIHPTIYHSGHTYSQAHPSIYNTAQVAKAYLPINNSGHPQAQAPIYNSEHTRIQVHPTIYHSGHTQVQARPPIYNSAQAAKAYIPTYNFGHTQVQTPIHNSGHNRIQVNSTISNTGHTQVQVRSPVYNTAHAAKAFYNSAYSQTQIHPLVYHPAHIQAYATNYNFEHAQAKGQLPIYNSGHTQAQGPIFNNEQSGIRCRENMRQYLTNCIYLEDSGVEIYGLKIYGAPWQPEYRGYWAFNLRRGEECLSKWNLIPNDTDILITHTPPLGYGDSASSGLRAGCVELLSTVQQRVNPKYHVFGHIHESYGVYSDGKIIYINASTCDTKYVPKNVPIVFDVPLPEGYRKK